MSQPPGDTQQFLRSLGQSGLFQPGEPVFVARAPGRLDVMGGISDYSGALVLQMPIAEAAHVAFQKTAGTKLHLISDDGQHRREQQFDAKLLEQGPDELRQVLAADASVQWTAYILGPMLMLLRDQHMGWSGGCRVLVRSDVPEGKGVSSSAALEVATMRAFAGALDIALDGPALATLCQQAENRVAGAPCGIMDQMTSACGQSNCLLMLLCQPARIQGQLPLPDGLAVWGIDSGIRHAVGGSDYGTVRTGAAMGFRIIADLLGSDRAPFDGYLANLRPSLFAERFADHLPARMTGQDFLDQHHGIFDPVVRVQPDRDYPVFAATAHPVFEQHRIQCYARLLNQGADPAIARLLGEMMYQSHASYGCCGLGSSGTDRLVGMVREADPALGLYGARITGGGSGGTVAILARADAGPAIGRIADDYAEHTGHQPRVFTGSSPGAIATAIQSWQP